MKTALVTGGAGFIGSHVVARLVSQGTNVRVLDNFETGKRENLAPFSRDIELFEADLRDTDAVKRACQGVEVVFHEAALPSVPRSIREPQRAFDVTLGGTNSLLLAARDAGVRRVVQASSSSIYGDQPTLPKHEGMPPSPLSPYAAHKLGAEQLGVAFSVSMGLEVVALRYFNVFGPRQDPLSEYAAVVPRFATACLTGKESVIYGDGEQSRDFTFIENVVDANLAAASSKGASGGVFNIACGARTTVNELFAQIARAAGKPGLVPRHVPARGGDIRHSHASIDRAREGLGWSPRVDLARGIDVTVAWYRDRT